MPAPLTVTRNDYHQNPKRSDIYTPEPVGRYLYELLRWHGFTRIFDVGIGGGALAAPWAEAPKERVHRNTIYGNDINAHCAGRKLCDNFIPGPFEEMAWPDRLMHPDLVLCNPPFNNGGRKLYPEVFLRKVHDLFGPTIPTVLFVPMGFRLNQRIGSDRWRWLRDGRARLTSILALPLDLFPQIQVHAEVLFFNIEGLDPHQFLPDLYLPPARRRKLAPHTAPH